MKKVFLAYLFTTISLTFSQMTGAQTPQWQSPELLSNQQSSTFIIHTSEPLKKVAEHWEIIDRRNAREYIVSKKPGIDYNKLNFKWKVWSGKDFYIPLFNQFPENDPSINTIIIFSPFIAKSQIEKILQDLSIRYHDLDATFKGINALQLKLSYEQIQRLAQNKYVTAIEPLWEDVPLNSGATALTQAHSVKSPLSIGGEGLTGQGIIIGIGDDGDNTHADHSHRIIRQFSPIPSTGHAIHVAVTASGNGIINESTEGFASQASILSHYFNAVLAYSEEMYTDFNMTITNNSYAQRTGDCNYAGIYNATSQAVDLIMNENPYVLHVFAAGNDGLITCAPNPTGFGTVVGFYQASKNALVVGNIGKNLQFIYGGSSKGPLRDGRIKPEIGAVGVAVFSGWTADSYVLNNGTSMASPNVAGAAALLSEKYKSLYGGQNPESALLKILLMNGAQEVYNPGPDYVYGFGIMSVQQSLNMLNNNQFQRKSITHDQTITQTITIPENVARAKMMIYWHDPAATPTPDDPSLSKLINDIDLTVSTPSGDNISPWILDPNAPAAPAVRGIDRINNVEQITLEYPAAGTYTLHFKGHRITTDSQAFYVAWDFEMNELQLSHPIGQEYYAEGDSLRIYYTYPPTTSTFNIELSVNNGLAWTTIASGLPSHQRHFNYQIPSGINSDKCKIRISVNGTSITKTSQNFTISQKPVIELDVDNLQCPGSISVKWNSIPNATAYILFLHEAGNMIPVDTVPSSQLKYNFAGLTTHQRYEVSVAPFFETQRGIRANATWRTPNNGNCNGENNPDYDLAVLDFYNLNNGRILTQSALPNNKIIEVIVQNRGKNNITQVPLTLVFNDDVIVSQIFTTTLTPGQKDTLQFNTHPLDLSSINVYTIKVYKHNIPAFIDPFTINDTIIKNIKQVDNTPIDIVDGYIEDFAYTLKTFYDKNYIGIDGAERWDYEKTAGFGRMTNFVNSVVSITDSHALSMDLKRNARATLSDSISTNQAIVTLNLGDYDILEKEIRFDFKYRFAGQPKFYSSNAVYLRGQDTDPWILVGHLDTTYAGEVKSTIDYSMNDILLSNGQNFSTSTQVKIQQKDTSLIAGIDFGNGLTIDHFRVYGITDDVALQQLLSPQSSNCELGSRPITVQVKNNVFYTMYNIPVSYQINGGDVHTETIDSIPSKAQINYTFSSEENFNTYGEYDIKVWVSYPSDEANNNDTLAQAIVITPTISEFPYLETFDSAASSQYYLLSGSAFVLKDNFPSSIKQAANGRYALTTQNIANDTTSRISYMYLPCLNTLELTQPTLSFSHAFIYSQEDPPNPTQAYLEYSEDGLNWIRLGSRGEGSNWYDNSSHSWRSQSFNWTSSSIDLPKGSSIRIRFVFESYPGNRIESWYIDDIFIYDRIFTINNTTHTASVLHTSDSAHFSNGSTQLMGIIANSTSMNNIDWQTFIHESPIITASNESLPMINVNVSHQTFNTYNMAITVPHSALLKLWQNDNCPACHKMKTFYTTNISTYFSDNKDELNNGLSDNISGTYQLIPRQDFYILPYYDGYIVVLKNNRPGEIWFHDSYPYNTNIGFEDVALSARQISHINAEIDFISHVDTFVEKYIIENRNLITGDYTGIAEFTSLNQAVSTYNWIDAPVVYDNKVTYRVRYILKDGSTKITKDVTIPWLKMGSFNIYPNPNQDGHLYITWNLDEVYDIDYLIYTTHGQLLHKGKIDHVENTLGFRILDLKQMNLPPGDYLIKFQSGKEKSSFKLIYLQ